MVDLYNDIIDMASTMVQKIKTAEFYKSTKESLTTNKDINGIINDIERNEDIKPYIDIIKNSGNNNTTKFEFRGTVYSLDYEKRRKIVYFVMGGLFVRHLLKTNYFRRFLFHYILLSGLLCRENFDLKNYKMN